MNVVNDKMRDEVCKIGQGHECCRYLGCGQEGFICLKHTTHKNYLDQRVREESINARGDNCEGLK